MQGERPAPVTHFPCSGNVGHHRVSSIVPKQDVIGARAAPVPIREVGRPCEAAAPGATVRADLVHGFDDQRLLANPFRNWRQLARLDQLRQLRRLLEALGELRGVCDDLWPLELPDQRTSNARSDRPGGSPLNGLATGHQQQQGHTE
jgi:hypothetical protein